MIDVPTLRADDTEELAVIVSSRDGNVCPTLRVDSTEMRLVLSKHRFKVVTHALVKFQ